MSVAVLNRPLYTATEAARLLEVPTSRLVRWLEGAKVGNAWYAPVIRVEPTGSRDVSWAEFVEAGLLREYRVRGVSLQRLRPFIEAMRNLYGVPYPLAHFKPLVDRTNNDLLLELKQLEDQVGLEEELALVHVISNQLVWAKPMRAFLDKVEFDHQGLAESLRPLGRKDPVVIDPRVAFGAPQVRGIRTEVVAEAVAAGQAPDELAGAYGLSVDEVMAAVRWELRIRSKTRAA